MNGSAQVWIKWSKEGLQNWQEWDWKTELPEVKAAWSTMGNWDMAISVECENIAALEQFVTKKLRPNKWVSETNTVWWNKVWDKTM